MSKKLICLAVTASSLALATSVHAVSIGDMGDLLRSRQSGYFTIPGGEFSVLPTSGPISNNAYVNEAANAGGLLGSFQTFCLEITESARNGKYTVSSTADLGGGGPTSPDPLSIGTSFLYQQFAIGALAYSYTPGAGREADAQVLQDAIWMLEHEKAADLGNAFLIHAFDTLIGTGIAGDALTAAEFAAIQADASVGQFDVYVLNVIDPTDTANPYRQDFLYFDDGQRRVPDGGASVVLLGLGLLGLGLVRKVVAA